MQQEGIGKTEVGIPESDNDLPTVNVHIPDTFHNDEIHIICEVHDNSRLSLPAYRRIIIRTFTNSRRNQKTRKTHFDSLKLVH